MEMMILAIRQLGILLEQRGDLLRGCYGITDSETARKLSIVDDLLRFITARILEFSKVCPAEVAQYVDFKVLIELANYSGLDWCH